MSKETWADEFEQKFPHKIAEVLDDFGATTKSEIKAFISKVREEAFLEERRRMSEAISNENIDLTDDEYIDVKTFRNTILALINKDK